MNLQNPGVGISHAFPVLPLMPSPQLTHTMFMQQEALSSSSIGQSWEESFLGSWVFPLLCASYESEGGNSASFGALS